MLTNKLFDTFWGVLQQQKTRPHIASLAEGHRFWEDLERARLEFEYALSEKLLALPTEKQIELITQILTLFKNSYLLLSAPAHLWHVDKWSDTGLVWYRESNEPPPVKAFRDECEQRISTDLENFLASLAAQAFREKEANQYVRLVTNPGAIGVLDEIELDYDEMDLHLEAARWIEEGLSAKVGTEAQENVRQHFEKLAGKEAAAHWIIKPESWYDTYREIQGLPPIQEPFQNSYEAWHFYFERPEAPTFNNPVEKVSDWNGLLCQPDKFGVPELIKAFKTVGLLNEDGKPTDWGMKSKGAWAGAIDALTAPPALLTVNADAVRRCLHQWGIVIKSSNSLRENTSAEADNTRKAMKRAVSGMFR